MRKRFAVGALVATGCVLAFIIAANVFPDATWNVVNEVRELRDLSPGLFRRQEPPHPPSVWGFEVAPYGDPGIARLANIGTFAFGGVGVAGQTSEGELDFRLILSRPNALALFEELYREGNLQGKSYALVGIRELKPDLFKELAVSLRESNFYVVTQSGCIVTHEPLRDIVRRIEREQEVVKFVLPPLRRRLRSDNDKLFFDSDGVGLTETLLRFAQQEHIPIAIEFVDSDSMNRPIKVSIRKSSFVDGLNEIFREGRGYKWEQRNEIVRVWNARSPRGRANLLDTVIPEFQISPQTTPQDASSGLWMALEVRLNPKIRGFAGDFPPCDQSQIVRQSVLRGKTVREILSYVVATSGADGWIVRVPPEHMGVVPQGGLWTVLQSRSPSCSYPFILKTMRPNFGLPARVASEIDDAASETLRKILTLAKWSTSTPKLPVEEPPADRCNIVNTSRYRIERFDYQAAPNMADHAANRKISALDKQVLDYLDNYGWSKLILEPSSGIPDLRRCYTRNGTFFQVLKTTARCSMNSRCRVYDGLAVVVYRPE